ncbi:MAG: TRAP transporter small permease [Geminicoccaceae bacterium]
MSDSRADAYLEGCDRALMRLEAATAWIGGLVIFLLMGLVTAEVVLRRLFNSPIPGQQDITILSIVAFGLLCISYCYRQSGHIRMDLVLLKTSGRLRWLLNLVVTLLALLTVTAIWPGTWNHFLRAFELGDTTFGIGLPTWPSKLAAPVGLGLLWLRLVLELWVFGRLIATPDAEPIGVPRPPDPREDMDA